MDLFLIIVLFIVFCVLFSICGWCCKKHKEGTIYGFATQSAQQAPAVPPYPIDPSRQPQPQPAPGFAVGGYQATAYPVTISSTAYPVNQVPTVYPMPIVGGYPPPSVPVCPASAAPYPTHTPYPVATTAAPYPPATGAPYPTPAGTQQSPPSYMEAVGQPPAGNYEKQAPYNPHY